MVNLQTSASSQETSSKEGVQIIARGASVGVLGRFISRIVRFFSLIILARILGPKVFGLYAIGWTFLRIIGLVSTIGLENGVIRYGSLYWGKDVNKLNNVIRVSIGAVVIIGIIIGILLFGFTPTLTRLVFRNPELDLVFRWIAPIIVLFSGVTVMSAVIRVSKKFEYSILVEDLIQPIIGFLLAILFLIMGWKLEGLLAALALSFILAFGAGLYFIYRLFPRILTTDSHLGNSFSNRQLFYFSIPTGIVTVCGILITFMGQLGLIYFSSEYEVGIYQAAFQISIMFPSILSIFVLIFSPMISNLYAQGENRELEELFRITTKWALYICLPSFLVIFFFSNQIMEALYGKEFIYGALSLIILSIAQLINASTGAVGFLLMMTGRQNRWLLFSIFALIVNFILCWVLITRLDLIGAAIATSISISILFLFGLVDVRRTLGLWPYDKRFLKGIGASLFTCVILLIFRTIFPLQNPLVVVILGFIFSYGAFTLILVGQGLDKEDKEFLYLVRMKIREII